MKLFKIGKVDNDGNWWEVLAVDDLCAFFWQALLKNYNKNFLN